MALTRDHITEGCIKFNRATPESFRIYLNWMYAHQLYLGDRPPEDAEAVAEKLRILVKTYVLGYKLRDTDFQDAIIDAIIELSIENSAYPTKQTKIVYEETRVGCPLRKFLVDVNVYQSLGTWREHAGDAGKDYHTLDSLFDVVKGLQSWKRSVTAGIAAGMTEMGDIADMEAPYLNKQNGCHYHYHGNGSEECYKVKYGV